MGDVKEETGRRTVGTRGAEKRKLKRNGEDKERGGGWDGVGGRVS
jgi:hypothetical protein